MGRYIELPNGPSGRTPIVAASLNGDTGTDRYSHLVLFEDGTLGAKIDERSGRYQLFAQTARSFDGSGYTMMYHSPKQFGKIEKTLNESKIPTYLLRFTLILGAVYFALFLYYRIHLQWPTFLNVIDEYVDLILFCTPILIWTLSRRVFDFSAGEIKVYTLESDPHLFPIAAKSTLSMDTILSVMIILILGCLYATGGLYCDLMLLFVGGYTIINYLTEGGFQQVFVINKGKMKTATADIDEFFNRVNSVLRDLKQKERIENPLLELLMSNESPTLEFKSSLWTQYHGVSGEIVKEQKKKMLELEDSVVKTVAAFLNTDGGILLIGVKDKPRSSGDAVAEILGIEPDFKWLNKKDTEGYQHSLIEIFRNAYSNPISLHNIAISFPEFERTDICRIDVEALPRMEGQQCFTNTKMETKYGKKELLFARIGDTTENMSPSTQYGYIRHHFEGYSGKNNES